jgi:hypothetical protein
MIAKNKIAALRQLVESRFQCCSVRYGVQDFTVCRMFAGPGDTIALMGLSAQCGVNLYLFVPPKDATRPASNCVHRCVQFLGSAAARVPPSLYLTIANGHFTALTNPTKKFVSANKMFGVEDFMREGFDPATAWYATSPLTALVLLFVWGLLRFFQT